MNKLVVGILLCVYTTTAAGKPPLPPGQDDPRVTPVVRAYRRAAPAVVNISSERIVAARWGLFGPDDFGLEDIFPAPVRRVPVHSLGSGVIIHPAGYVVTNAHVVRRAEKITVTLLDASRYAAKVIAAEEDQDLAVLRLQLPADKKLPSLSFGRSDDLMVGETVIAIGNPLGYANTLTTGVISATDRTLEFRGNLRYEHLIQTDAPINPGNSGGPLLNIKGELIGINTAIRSDAQNIGFAIPIDTLHRELAHLLDVERLRRVVFGAEVVVARLAGIEGPPGLYVAGLQAGTPAAEHLKVGDHLLELNGIRLRQMPDFVCTLHAAAIDEPATIRLRRGEKELLVTVRLRVKPPPDGDALAWRYFGMRLRDLTPALARKLGLPIANGLLVVAMERGGPADRLGVQLKDVLFQVGKYYVTDLDELGLVLENLDTTQPVRIGILRGRVRAWAPIRPRDRAPQPALPDGEKP